MNNPTIENHTTHEAQWLRSYSSDLLESLDTELDLVNKILQEDADSDNGDSDDLSPVENKITSKSKVLQKDVKIDTGSQVGVTVDIETDDCFISLPPLAQWLLKTAAKVSPSESTFQVSIPDKRSSTCCKCRRRSLLIMASWMGWTVRRGQQLYIPRFDVYYTLLCFESFVLFCLSVVLIVQTGQNLDKLRYASWRKYFSLCTMCLYSLLLFAAPPFLMKLMYRWKSNRPSRDAFHIDETRRSRLSEMLLPRQSGYVPPSTESVQNLNGASSSSLSISSSPRPSLVRPLQITVASPNGRFRSSSVDSLDISKSLVLWKELINRAFSSNSVKTFENLNTGLWLIVPFMILTLVASPLAFCVNVFMGTLDVAEGYAQDDFAFVVSLLVWPNYTYLSACNSVGVCLLFVDMSSLSVLMTQHLKKLQSKSGYRTLEDAMQSHKELWVLIRHTSRQWGGWVTSFVINSTIFTTLFLTFLVSGSAGDDVWSQPLTWFYSYICVLSMLMVFILLLLIASLNDHQADMLPVVWDCPNWDILERAAMHSQMEAMPLTLTIFGMVLQKGTIIRVIFGVTVSVLTVLIRRYL